MTTSTLEIRLAGTTEQLDDALCRLGALYSLSGMRRRIARSHPSKILLHLDAEPRDRHVLEDPHATPEHQPWWPPQAGDVVIAHPYGSVDGATYVAEDHLECGQIRLRMVSAAPGRRHSPEHGYSIGDVWQEWPAISVARAGVTYRSQKVGGGR